MEPIWIRFNNQGIRRLIDINGHAFDGITDYPKMTHTDIEKPDLTAFANFLKGMIDAGVITPDPELERYVRQIGGLPEKVATEQPDGEGDPQDQTPVDEKSESATMYKIQSALSKYIRGEFPRDLTKQMLEGIGINEERAEEYLQSIDRNHKLSPDGQTVLDGTPSRKSAEARAEHENAEKRVEAANTKPEKQTDKMEKPQQRRNGIKEHVNAAAGTPPVKTEEKKEADGE